MNYQKRREAVLERMEEDSILVLYSGIETHIGSDTYHDFEANRNFFYLTGLRRDHMILLMKKIAGKADCLLYIPKVEPLMERWTGKMVTREEAQALTGITEIRLAENFDRELNALVSMTALKYAYFDCLRERCEDLPHYNLAMARKFAENYPAVTVRNLWPIAAELRMEKDGDEIDLTRKAIEVTDESLKRVLRTLKPGMKEYQAQAEFEYTLHRLGAEGTAFPTIAGSGANGTMLHYETNRETCEDGTLLLLDLGAKWEGYNADITRTYPVNGKYTERQRSVYQVVLEANRTVAREAKPGMTLKELNERCKQILAKGCIGLGLIDDEQEIGKYYMHSVSHHLGIDVHDVSFRDRPLTPGCVITDEPGLYIDEWGIGIRIEDDLLITEDGCVCLSEQIMREPDEIEAYMARNLEKN